MHASVRRLALALALAVSVSQLLAQPAPIDPLTLVQQGRRLNTEGKQAEALACNCRHWKASPDLFEAHSPRALRSISWAATRKRDST